MAEILLGIKKVFDDAGLKFYVIDCILDYPPENTEGEAERIEVNEFLYSDIYEDGLAERVEAADKAAKNYYAELDAEMIK